jgi:gephyrin
MSSPDFRAAILVVSTTASKDPSADQSAGILRDVFDQDGGGRWEVSDTRIVSDEVLDIQRRITTWTDGENPVNLIITTGGTGFAIQDSTPEVCDVLNWSEEHVVNLNRPSLLSCTSTHRVLYMACSPPH